MSTKVDFGTEMVKATQYLLPYFVRINVLKGTGKPPAVDLSRLKTPRNRFLTPKMYYEQSRPNFSVPCCVKQSGERKDSTRTGGRETEAGS